MTIGLSATTPSTPHNLINNPYNVLQQGVILVVLSVAIISVLIFNQYTDIDRFIESHQTKIIILGTMLLIAFSIVYSNPLLLLLVGGIAFAIFFGLALSLTVVILYYLRRIPIGGNV